MKKLILGIVLLLSTIHIYAQNSTGEKWTDRLVFGGGGGGGSIPGGFLISLSPAVGYKVTDDFIAGVQIPYIFVSEKIFNKTVNTHHYGISPFARYFFSDKFFVHGEFENMSFQTIDPVKIEPSTRLWFTSPMIGAGYNMSFGEGRSGAYIMALYILNYDTNRSLYGSPLVLRVGFLL